MSLFFNNLLLWKRSPSESTSVTVGGDRLRRWFSGRAPRRRSRAPRDTTQKLEDRVVLTCECYADLFAGPRLVDFNSDESELLEGVFNALLPGSHVDLTVADWNAIADGNLNVPNFLAALQANLNLGSPEQALDANITLAQLFDAAADAIPADGATADLHAALLGLVGDVDVSELMGTIQLGDLLQVTFPDGSFADVDIDALNLVTGAIQLFNYDNVVTTTDPVTIPGTVLNNSGINTVTIWAQVIEPPIIDPIVCEGEQFYSAAVRLKMNVDLVDFTVLGTNVTIGQLELYADVARAQGVVSLIDHVTSAVDVQASHGVTNVYLGSISDSLFFNRTHIVTPADLDFIAVGSVNPLLGPTLTVEARGYAEGTAPLASLLHFTPPYPQTQTTGTSAVFIANAVNDLLTSLEARVTLGGLTIPDPTGGIRQIVADVIDVPLTEVLSDVADPVLDLLGIGIGEMDVTINAVNCRPIANDDFVTTPEDTPIAIDILANDTDEIGGIDPTTVVIVTPAAHGSLSVNPTTGVVTYTPALNFNGTDTFTYTVADTNGTVSNVATVTITVTPVNDAPDAVNDVYTTAEDTPLIVAPPGVLSNDTDVDGDSLTVTTFSDPPHGTVIVNSNGSLSYTPDANFNGTDSFTYTISDGHGGTDTATVTVNVTPVNDAPDAVNDVYTTPEDSPLTVIAPGVLSNDTDVDGDGLTVTAFSDPPHGTVIVNSNGSVSYTPDANFNGTDSFIYTISDGHGGADTATVTINVTAVNDAPDAVNDVYTTAEDTPLTVAPPGVLSNDTDVDGDSLTVTTFSDPPHGTVIVNSNGSLSYTPDANFNGADSFTYTISDGHGGSDTATVTVNVTSVNDAPDAVDDVYTTAEDTPLTVAAPGVLANDTDVDGDGLTVTAFSDPPHGTVIVNSNGSVSFTPDANFNGTDSFTYTISDGHGGSDTATVTINVTAVNDAPDAVNDVFTTPEDTPLTVAPPGVLANDTDADGDTLTVTTFSDPPHGAVLVNPDGSLSYTPDANFTGADTFTYTVSDGHGGTDTATVTVNVTAANDAPDAVDDVYTTPEDSKLTVIAPGVLSNDTDADGDNLTVTAFSDPPHGTVVVNPNGSVSYTPDANFNGTDTFTYTVSDGHGGTDTATVTINVTSVNDVPDAVNDTYSAVKNTTLTVPAPGVLSNDTDADGDTLTVTAFSDPPRGTVVVNGDGSMNYTPDTNFTGTDTFTYTISDGHGGTDTATVTVRVGPPNRAPDAVNDVYTTTEDTPRTVAAPGVLSNDRDPDRDSLTVTTFSDPPRGTVVVNPNGSMTYTPDANFNGTDTFTYTISDGRGGTDTATVTIRVSPKNDAPDAVNDTFTTSEDAVLTVAPPGVLANDTDVDGDSLKVTAFSDPPHGTVKVNANGSLTYTPDRNFTGTDTFTYTISDGHGGTDTATVTVNVTPVNDPPDARNDVAVTQQNLPITVPVLSNDSDPEGNPLEIIAITDPPHGSVLVNPDGTVTYVPDPDFIGTDSFTYTISDGQGGTDSATVIVTTRPLPSDDPERNCCDGNPLQVLGTDGTDKIIVYPVGTQTGASTDKLKVVINGVTQIDPSTGLDYFTGFSAIVVQGFDGNDYLEVKSTVLLQSCIFGGNGNDYIEGGKGNNLLLGEEGNDTIYGGHGRNVMIGGNGADRLSGAESDDLMIAGTTDWDESDDALCAIMDEWLRKGTGAAYLDRVTNLRDDGVVTENGVLVQLNDQTVHDDGAKDTLAGGSGLDWFLLNVDGDGGVKDTGSPASNEVVTDIDFMDI